MENVLASAVLLVAGTLSGDLVWRWACSQGSSVPPVSLRLVRLVCGLMWAGLALVYGCGLETVELCFLSLVLVALSLTDLASLTIPNACIVTAVAIRVAYIAMAGMLNLVDPAVLLVSSLAGALGTFVPLLLLTLLLDHLLGMESLGGGDLKLLAVAGMYVGWMVVPLLMLACLLGFAGSVAKARGQLDALAPFAFGPAISCAFWITLMVAGPLEAGFVRWMF